MYRLIVKYWKYSLFVLLVGTAGMSFLQTGMVSEAGIARYFEAFYYSLSLFIIGGLVIGLPSGGSSRKWCMYTVASLLKLRGFLKELLRG